MKTAILFPGQGSQYVGMGKEFIEADQTAAELLKTAEEVCGLPLGDLIMNGPMEELTRNAVVQPAITVTNLICWNSVKNKLGDIPVSYFAGHSLGEYSALCASGVLSSEDTLKLVAKRGALMEREGTANPGGMRAVLGLTIDEIDAVIAGYSGEGVVCAANHNCPQQIVISGSMEGLDGVNDALAEKGAKVIPLNVSVANHSPLIAKAVPDFTEFIEEITFNTPQTPVFFNVSASTETDPVTMKKMMANQIASKVRWCEIITTMIEDGVDTFIEVGPKTVLKGMMRKITPKGTKVTSLQCDSLDTLEACLGKIS